MTRAKTTFSNAFNHSIIMVTLGERIRHQRRQSGLSLLELEKRIGIKKEYLSRIETNALPNPTYKTIQIIAQGLGIDLIRLFEYSPPLPPKIRLFSATEPTAESKPEGWVAIPIINQQLAHHQPLSLSSKEAEGYFLIAPFFIPHITETGTYRALYLDEDDHSMSPVIPAGSLICIDFGPPDIPQLVGKMVLLMDGEAKCRVGYLGIEDDFIIGIPYNIRHYSPLIIPLQRRDSVLGRVVGCFCIPPT